MAWEKLQNVKLLQNFAVTQREFWVVFHLFCYNEIMDLLSTSGRPQTFTKMEITRNKIKHLTIFISIYLIKIKHKAESYYEFPDIKISFVFIILLGERKPWKHFECQLYYFNCSVSAFAAQYPAKKVASGVKLF